MTPVTSPDKSWVKRHVSWKEKYSSLNRKAIPSHVTQFEAGGTACSGVPHRTVQTLGTTALFTKPGSLTPADFCSFSKNRSFWKQVLIGCWLIRPSLLKSKWFLSCHCDCSGHIVIIWILSNQRSFFGPYKVTRFSCPPYYTEKH